MILFKPVFPVLNYFTNYDYISTVLCENTSEPQLKCNGKCHLKKELARASEIEKPINSDKKQNVKQEIEVLFCESIAMFKNQPNFNFELNKVSLFYQNFYQSKVLTSIFHPPTSNC